MIEQWFSELTVWHWLILGVLLMALEMLAPGFVLLWFGVAAVATGLVVAALDPAWQAQVLVFAVFSGLALYGGRRFFAGRPATSDHPTLNQRGATYVGRTYTLDEPLLNGVGRLRIDDTMWRVTGPDAPAGTRVTVIGSDGATLVVQPAGGQA